jgi:filamentous hemagglutinin family protein
MMKYLHPVLATTALFLVPAIASAQTYQPTNRDPVADNTLGTQVSGNGNNFNITGGVTKGQTLFHSFTDFSVPTNGQANFLNPVGNRDIITRVTGNLFSDINGTVNTNGANFFLINPNGIVFGTNAKLNVGKAFVGSTANSIDLVDGSGRAITFGTNPNGDAPLLSVAPNVLFDVSRLNLGGGNGAISNFGTLQTPNNSQYIGLIGGNVTLDGSAGGGKIIAPGGRVDIGGLNSAGSVSIDNNGLIFSSTGVGRSNVVLTNDAGITVRATETLDTVSTFFNNATSNGSSINISANNLDVLNSGAKLSEQPAAIDAGLEKNSVQTQPAGDINIEAIGKVNLNNADIKNTLRTGSEGSIDGIKIQAGTLDVKNNSIIATVTRGKGNAGNIDINVVGDILISGNESSSTDPNLSNISAIGSNTFGEGDAGKITIDTQGKLSLINLGDINSSVGDTGVGNGRGIFITARELNLINGSYITSSTSKSAQGIARGNAGDINIKTTGDINIAGYNSSATNLAVALSYINSDTNGSGDAGKITIDAGGKLSVSNQGSISSDVQNTAVGNSKGITISARELDLVNDSSITTNTLQAVRINGKGNAGDINITTTGDIKIAGANSPSFFTSNLRQLSFVSGDSRGYGDTGKVSINTQGNLSVFNGIISSDIAPSGIGNSKGVEISAREIKIVNNSAISTVSLSKEQGNAGNIKIKTTGDFLVAGYDPSSNYTTSDLAQISSFTVGKGDTGKITIETQGKLSVVNGGRIGSIVAKTATGNSQGISINAREIELGNRSSISTDTFQENQVDGKGNAGDIDIKTIEDIKISGYDSSSTNRTTSDVAQISSTTFGQGNAGKITINTQGKLSVVNQGNIIGAATDTAVGNSQGIDITARELEIANGGVIGTDTFQKVQVNGKGNAGNINIKTTGDILISGSDPSSNVSENFKGAFISSSTSGQGDAGKIIIDTQGKISISNGGSITSRIDKNATGNSKGISIAAREIKLNSSFIGTDTEQVTQVNGTGKAGNIDLKVKESIFLNNLSSITTRSTGVGEVGNVSISTSRLFLNEGGILSDANSVTGGNVTLSISDLLLMQNSGFLTTNSGSTQKNGNGGNITISSPLIVATSGDNNITANANGGNGGNVDITSQGLFGIQYRPIGSDFTSDITASSTFGQNGAVNISTPGSDPGRDSTELPNTTTDASNQISQVCGASTRQNKLTVAGRGGIPPNANDPLTSDVVWQDARAASSQPAASSATTNSATLPPPAVGWVFDGKGKVTLVAAGSQGQPTTGTSVVCPNVVR